jgi:ornithine carbamoyltransferase
MHEMYDTTQTLPNTKLDPAGPQNAMTKVVNEIDPFAVLRGKKVVWVGDTNNVLHDMLVSFPRLGMTIAVASPKGYDKVDERVWAAV